MFAHAPVKLPSRQEGDRKRSHSFELIDVGHTLDPNIASLLNAATELASTRAKGESLVLSRNPQHERFRKSYARGISTSRGAELRQTQSSRAICPPKELTSPHRFSLQTFQRESIPSRAPYIKFGRVHERGPPSKAKFAVLDSDDEGSDSDSVDDGSIGPSPNGKTPLANAMECESTSSTFSDDHPCSCLGSYVFPPR